MCKLASGKLPYDTGSPACDDLPGTLALCDDFDCGMVEREVQEGGCIFFPKYFIILGPLYIPYKIFSLALSTKICTRVFSGISFKSIDQ